MMALRKAPSITQTSILSPAGRSSQQCNEWGRSCIVLIATLASFFAMGLQQAHGQANTASIEGVVTDPSGAAIPQARVVGTDMSNGFTYPTATSTTGVYVLENLPPATYKITVVASGFKQFARPNITLVVGQRATVDAEMNIGSSAQTVTVTAAPPLLQMQDASTGQNIGRTDIDNMPVYGRDVWNLAYLSAGVVQAPGNAYGTGGSNDFISNGGRYSTDDVLVDGEAINSGMSNGTATVGPMWTPSEDVIQEFTIEQNNFSADKGAQGNSIVNVATRSGTNKFHGTAYEFLQNSALNANDWFSNRAEIPLAVGRNNNFGATAGGPIQKNKMFFFAHYEGIKAATATGPAPYTLGNAPRIVNVFAPGTKNANLSLFKEFSLKKLLGEEGRLQFRIETFNALNHVQFGAPDTGVGPGGTFGLVPYQANSPRLVQIAGKVYW